MISILIVDDSAFLRRIIKGYLAEKRSAGPLAGGCVILEAATKDDALRAFRNEQPALVLLDIVMESGDRTGIEILAELMSHAPRPKVIMMSAVGQERVITECMTLGAAGYILKPFDESQVLNSIEGALADKPSTVSSGVQ